ncbi:hypothetical protein BCR43DRAFT_483895 [Syncephalastrum racemosum]|uniref:Secreted protein n=1 Tax=Syncephalastrum racemosum TaxID=13706 RepID=A0A1X2HVW2_SYNRA|nr:hypothetical protein BCR43DRAFT_483895 [Syncephalastrum racemosum]
MSERTHAKILFLCCLSLYVVARLIPTGKHPIFCSRGHGLFTLGWAIHFDWTAFMRGRRMCSDQIDRMCLC